VIRGGATFRGKQGLEYKAGISAETAGATGISMHRLDIPPGATAQPHFHEAHETAIFILEGSGAMRHGPRLEQVMIFEAGDFIYIPAGVPHQPYNPTDAPVVRSSRARIRTSRKASSCSTTLCRALPDIALYRWATTE
jgi:uncharacterized RmlC-like cupin family protein